MKYRSEGEEEGLKVRAAADQEKSGILSEALQAGAADRAARARAGRRGSMRSRSPEAPDFYRFVRTMQAPRNLVPKETTLVLPADSELFGLLQDSSPLRPQRRDPVNRRRADQGGGHGRR